MSTPRYAVITPVRDEEKHLGITIRSMASQSVLPTEWVIVDDGSSDRTGEISKEASQHYKWIHVIHRRDRGHRKAGSGVVEAFYAGYEALRTKRFDFLVKLDGDLSFATDYFQRCFDEFQRDPSLGIGGGVIMNLIDGSPRLEKQPAFHVRGATKIYRRDCWEAIGGIVSVTGWDTLDEVKANMLGWSTRSFPDISLIQQRQTGAAAGTWRNAVKNGRANYISGYHPLFMLTKCIRRLIKPPFFAVGAVGLLYGYIGGYLAKVEQIRDRKLIAYLRRQQLRRILLRETVWH
jgi:glycosyltransferase involved in cell wall biosynthesis